VTDFERREEKPFLKEKIENPLPFPCLALSLHIKQLTFIYK